MVAWEALDALSHELELCKIDASSRAVLIVDDALTPQRCELLRAALERSGAEAIELRSIGHNSAVGSDTTLVGAALASADFVITTGQPIDDAMLGSSARVLDLPEIEPHQLHPHVSLRTRTQALTDQLSTANELSIHDPHGTDLHIALTGGEVAADYGFVDDDLRRSQFPAGWAAITPADATVNGELVIMPGDANLGAQRLISSPIRLQILDDHVSQIQGESPDADVVRALFEYAGEPEAYGVSGIAVGLNPGGGTAEVFDNRLLDPILSRLMAGVVTISFGNNPVANRPCGQTIALAVPGRSLVIDGLPVVTGGALQGDFAPDVYEL